MIKAYILASSGGDPTAVTSATEYLAKIRKVKGVKQAHFLFGDIGGIAYVEVEDLEELIKTIDSLFEIGGEPILDARITLPR